MKRFALHDTLPDPYFPIDAGGIVSVETGSLAAGRMSVEIWRNGKILCRVFAELVHVALEPRDGSEAWRQI